MKKQEILISIIVPAYNMEAYLDRCLVSLLHQDLDTECYEIIIVNDGSTDSTEAICQDYARNYHHIRVISKINEGQSVARNIGVMNAKGLYVCFVDADDYLSEKGLALLLPYCDGDYDLIRFWCNIVHPHTKSQFTPVNIVETFRGDGLDYIRHYGLETFCWNWLYKREFLANCHLKFVPRLIGEDFRFMTDVLFANPFVVSISLRIYNYIIRSDSISTRRSKNHSRQWVEDLSKTICYVNERTELYRQSDAILYTQIRHSLEFKFVSLTSRCLSADYSLKEFRSIFVMFKTIDLLPLKIIGESLRLRLVRYAINTLYKMPLLYLPAKFIYCQFFLRFIYPKFDRNG